MYAKRFIQLFVMFLIAIFIALFCVVSFGIQGYLAQALVLTIVGYIVLIIPLTALTIMKQRKKFSKDTNTTATNAFQKALGLLDNVLVLSTVSADNVISASMITFKQSSTAENVFYIVTKKTTTRVQNIKATQTAAITTWFDQQTGTRVSSNAIDAVVIAEQDIKQFVAAHPEIKALSEDFSNHAIIQLTLRSALVESFQSNPTVIDFQA